MAVKFKSQTNTVESSGVFTIEENLDKIVKKIGYVEFFNTFYAEWLQIGSQFVKYVKVLFSKKDFFVPKLIRHFDSYLNSNSFADFIVW